MNDSGLGSLSATVDGVAQSGTKFWAPVDATVVVTPTPAQYYLFKQ